MCGCASKPGLSRILEVRHQVAGRSSRFHQDSRYLASFTAHHFPDHESIIIFFNKWREFKMLHHTFTTTSSR